jgi:hypothetical protein
MLKTLLVGTGAALLALSLTGCASNDSRPGYTCKSPDQGPITCTLSEIFHPTQAPWDPPAGHTLMDQIPNWDGEANRVCCGRDPSRCKPGQSPRC